MTVWVYYSINKPTNSWPKVQRQHDLFVITKLIPFKASLLYFLQWTRGHKFKHSTLYYISSASPTYHWGMDKNDFFRILLFILLSTNLEMKGNEQLQSTSGSASHPLPVHFWPALCPQLYPTDFYLYVDMVHLLCRFSTNIVFFEKLRNYPNLTKKS